MRGTMRLIGLGSCAAPRSGSAAAGPLAPIRTLPSDSGGRLCGEGGCDLQEDPSFPCTLVLLHPALIASHVRIVHARTTAGCICNRRVRTITY